MAGEMTKKDEILQRKEESRIRADEIRREVENTKDVFPPKQLSYYLVDMYMDLVEYLRELHPTIPISRDVRDLNKYNPMSGSIVDDYKNILHLKMLSRIPNLDVRTGSATRLIVNIFKKHGLDEPDLKMAIEICSDLDEIISTRLGPPGKSSYMSR